VKLLAGYDPGPPNAGLPAAETDSFVSLDNGAFSPVNVAKLRVLPQQGDPPGAGAVVEVNGSAR